MNKAQKKALRELRPELQELVIKQASKGLINFNVSKSEQLPVDIGLFGELKTKDQTELF